MVWWQVPDVLRLARRLIADRLLPAGVRIRVVLSLAYLASPIDQVPDFIPVIGYADDGCSGRPCGGPSHPG